MKIHGATVLVTGANRGIGLAFTRELLARGARKVYAGARDPKSVTQPGVEAIQLDVTRPEQIAAAAARLGDVTLVINNAGVGQVGGFLATDSEEVARRQLETNYFGVLRMSKAFAPILAANGGGGIINVLSIVTWVNNGFLAAYSPASRPPGRSPIHCGMNFRARTPRCSRCTWVSSTPTSCEGSMRPRRPPRKSSSRHSMAWRRVQMRCSATT